MTVFFSFWITGISTPEIHGLVLSGSGVKIHLLALSTPHIGRNTPCSRYMSSGLLRSFTIVTWFALLLPNSYDIFLRNTTMLAVKLIAPMIRIAANALAMMPHSNPRIIRDWNTCAM